MTFLLFLSIAALVLLLAAVVVGDIRHRRIPNGLCLTIAGLALPFWIAAGPHSGATVGTQLLLWIAMVPVLLALFYFRIFGGGDIKLMAALLLWLTPVEALDAFFVMALAGAVLGVIVMLTSRGWRRSVPYGVAIAIGMAAPISDWFIRSI